MTTSPPLSRATVLRICPGVLVKRVGKEGVVLVPGENRFLAVTEVGARTLELVDGATSVGGILSSLLEEYDVSRKRLEADVISLFGELVAAKVLARV